MGASKSKHVTISSGVVATKGTVGGPAAGQVVAQDEPKPRLGRRSTHQFREANQQISFLAESQSDLTIKTLGVYLPFALFVGQMGFITFYVHRLPIVPWVISIIGLDIALIGAWPPNKGTGHQMWDYFPVLALLLSIIFGQAFGMLNAANMEPYVHATYLREYSGVRPGERPLAFADAGIIHFAPGSSLDIARSAGFKAWPHTYCAAPIVGEVSGTESAHTVGFWAVGINCCDGRENFWCDGAKDEDAHSGLRFESDAMAQIQGHDVAEHFRQAVHKAASTEGMAVSDSPILVAWSKDPKGIANVWWWVAVSTFLGCAACAAFFGAICYKMLSWHLAMVKAKP